jgi:hypothetical protein
MTLASQSGGLHLNDFGAQAFARLTLRILDGYRDPISVEPMEMYAALRRDLEDVPDAPPSPGSSRSRGSSSARGRSRSPRHRRSPAHRA